MGCQNCARNGEAHSGSCAPGGASFATIKFFEDPRQINRTDSGSVIFDTELKPLAVAAAAQCDAASWWAVTRRILEQVSKDASQKLRIEPYRIVRLIDCYD